METEHTETVVEKAVTYVKDLLGIHPAEPDVEANSAYTDTAPEVTAENAMRLNPNAYAMESIEHMDAEGHVAPESETFEASPSAQHSMNTMGETEAEHELREDEEHPRQKTTSELAAESAPFQLGK